MANQESPHVWEVGSSLFKYHRLSSEDEIAKLKKIIIEGEIWLSSPEKFNDPFECNIDTIEFSANVEEWKIFAKRMLKRTHPDWNRGERRRWINSRTKEQIIELMDFESIKNRLQTHFREAGIACFTKAPDNYLMWSHYTDGHKGVCLEFDQGKMPFNMAVPIQYATECRVFEVPPFDNDAIIESLYLTKAKCWKYEEEYRFALPNRQNTPYKYEEGALISITFGCRTPKKIINNMAQWIPHLKPIPKLYIARLKKNEYGLEFKALGVSSPDGVQLIWPELEEEGWPSDLL